MKMKSDRQEPFNDYQQESMISPTGAKIKITPWRWFLLLLILCSPLIFFLTKFTMHLLTMRIPGHITIPQVEIRAIEDGYIKKISVKLGQPIKAGKLLCQLEQPELQKKASLLKSEVDYLRQNPAKKSFKNTETFKRIHLEFAVNQKNYMKQHLDEITELFNRGSATEAEVKLAKFQYEETLARLADLDASIARAKDTTLMMQSAAENKDELRIKELELERKKLALQAKALFITSPAPGSITEILASEGNYVARGDLLFTVAKNEKIQITAYLESEDTQDIQQDQTAHVVFADGERTPAKIVKVFTGGIVHPHQGITTPSKNYDAKIQLEFIQPVKQKLMNGLPVDIIF